MNPRKMRFAEYYRASSNGTESAIKAGYSKKTAYSQANRLLKDIEVQNYIKELESEEKDKRILDARDRKIILSDIARDDINDPQCRIKAIDTLNKMTGEYMQKQQNDSGEKELPKLLEALEDTDDI